jgi:thiamine phosphate synthase YjbQ (UPF0047 family)
MKIVRETLDLTSTGQRPTFHTITDEVKKIVHQSGIQLGSCLVYSRHTTCAVMIDEDSFDKGIHRADLLAAGPCGCF